MPFRAARVLISAALLSATFIGCHNEEAPPPASPAPTTGDVNVASAAPPAQTAAPGSTPGENPNAPRAISVGSAPPDFTTKAHDGTTLSLSSLKGKPVVIYFYPKDESPACTKEACSFRDSWNELRKKDAVLIGVSADSEKSHQDFAQHYKLPFLLVSDPQGVIARSFGVSFEGGMADRQTVVIGADGKVKKIYRTVDVSKHATEVAKDLSS
ncbi:peroxiredoxin [Pendulispora brunnea]|uniref:thioredoxin-dependent peroxiredoxin n=1 Tax=Pendulispora brunnea TaxID=2905690 RepID=A0ABZ2KC79_9BACT